MRILLDTHAFLWIIDDDKRLSAHARHVFLNPENAFFFSAASYWEICLKLSVRKLALEHGWSRRIDRELSENAIRWLDPDKKAFRKTLDLPFHHRDPFDRLLIAQAQVERLAVMTGDTAFDDYEVRTVW